MASQFEYQIVYITHDNPNEVQTLNEHGNQGWEIVSIHHVPERQIGNGWAMGYSKVYLKRSH